jgi:hypothetical protein
MTAYEFVPGRAGVTLTRPVELVCFALIVAYAVYLPASFIQGSWLIAPDGGGVPSDFVNVWAAGKLALEGHAAAAYNWPVHKAAEVAALGHPFDGYFGWHYPPAFLFAAMALALLPYTAAYGFWVAATFPIYLATIRAIIGDRSGYWLGAAFPAVLCNIVVGQNGFLSAGLFGGALVMLEKQPIAAGVLFGLLTYKPHLGILIPLALAAGGYWRTMATAGIVATALAAASYAAFGIETWAAFAGNIGHTSQAFLSDGWADFGKLQTPFGLVRRLGMSETLAWCVQGAVAAAAAIAIVRLWRSSAAADIKAAGLVTAALLATPYLYTYDLVVLAVPLAFLFRFGRGGEFLPYELTAIGTACALVLIFPLVTAPVGLAANLVVAALVARRWVANGKPPERHVALQ